MSLFSLASRTGDLADLERGLVDRSYTQRCWSVTVTTVAAAATYRYPLGMAERDGLVLKDIQALTGTAVAASGSAYFTFKPYLVTLENGVAKKAYVGTSVGTNTLGIAADRPFRCHAEADLARQIPKDAALWVEMVVTGTPAAVVLGFAARLHHAG